MSASVKIDNTWFEKMDALAVARSEGPFTTDFDRLLQQGIHLPPPETLDDKEVNAKLWEVIEGLSDQRLFLHNTDHLDDRALYEVLWRDKLRVPVPDVEEPDGMSTHLDLLGGGSEEDIETFLRYYADEAYREMWAQDFPEDEIPPHEDPPSDRDRFLPDPHRE